MLHMLSWDELSLRCKSNAAMYVYSSSFDKMIMDAI
jgi:hypothetical protein